MTRDPLFTDEYIDGLHFEETRETARQMNADWVSGKTQKRYAAEAASSPASPKPTESMTAALKRLRTGPERVLAARVAAQQAARTAGELPANFNDLTDAAKARAIMDAKSRSQAAARAVMEPVEAALQADRDAVRGGVEKLTAREKPSTDEGRIASMMATQQAYDRLSRLGALDGSDIMKQRAAVQRAIDDAVANEDRSAFEVLRRELALAPTQKDNSHRAERAQLLAEIAKAEDPLRTPAERQGLEVAAELDAGWSRLELALGDKPTSVVPTWDGSKHLTLDEGMTKIPGGNVELFAPAGVS